MNRDIIALGYAGTPYMWVSVICNEAGLAQLPVPLDFYTDGGGNLPIGARFPLTEVNLIAFRMMGVLSDRDLPPMLAKIREHEEKH